MSKIKILFVVAGFYRGGAERFAYEIDKFIDKKKFIINILCLEKSKNINPMWKVRYYEKLHKDLGTKIIYTDDFVNKPNNHGLINKILKKLRLKETNNSYWNEKFYDFLNQYNVIHWMGEYTYINSVSENIREKSLIHMMSARFQNENLYNKFNHQLHYNFCTPFKPKELEYELEKFEDYSYIHIPLLLEINKDNKKWKYENSQIKKIGIFTRLDPYKPLDPFFYSFQVLLDKLPNTELHIFGNGNSSDFGIKEMIDRLGIGNKIFFRGHSESITETIILEKINLSWFHGYNNDRPAGYAGLDVCSTGTPLICWDFCAKPNNNIKEPIVYPHYKNINQFVSKSIEILTNQFRAEELSSLQSNDIFTNRNTKDHIWILEQEYERIYLKQKIDL